MWPHEPDDFESAIQPPATFSHPEACYFLCIDGQIAGPLEHGIPRPLTRAEFSWLDIEIRTEHYLGRWRGRDCFAVEGAGRLPQGYTAGGLRGWLGRVDPVLFYLAGRAQQLVEFHNTHRFCGRCGNATDIHPEERARVCPRCAFVSYQRLAPSIIVLVTRGNEMLLARNASWPTGMYSTLAGFVEAGESIEQTVHREVLEEVGLKVRNLRYRGSQSWPFPNSLMLGFHAEYASGEIVCQPSEIDDARWFAPDALPDIPPRMAISRWLIDDFLASERSIGNGVRP